VAGDQRLRDEVSLRLWSEHEPPRDTHGDQHPGGESYEPPAAAQVPPRAPAGERSQTLIEPSHRQRVGETRVPRSRRRDQERYASVCTRPQQVKNNPLDFQRFVFGVGYKYSSYLRLALDAQYLAYLKPQFDFPASEAKEFGLKSGVKDAVPPDILAVFLNLEFNY
jgi:hypothetical protein